MDVNSYVENFIKEFDIKEIDIYTLKMIIPKLGYELIEYSPLINNEHVDAIINGLNVKDILNDKSCFTYKSKLASYIFVRKSLSEHELIYLLLHEIGHIYMHHVDMDTTEKPEYYEHEANKFADDVKYYVYQNRLKRKALYIVPAFVVSALIVIVVALNYKNNKPDVIYEQEPSVDITETVTESTTEALTEVPVTEITTAATVTEPIAEQSENDQMLYYVSASGTKYHTRDYYHINPEKCTALPLEQILEIGYTPCRTCEPDKRS